MNLACCTLLLAGVFFSSSAAAQDAPTAPSPEKPAAATAPTRAFATADDLLAALETADSNLRTFESDLRYTKSPNELVGGSPEVRTGKLWFESQADPAAPADAAPARRFQIEFTTLELDNTRREDHQVWVFDGEWLTEKNFKTRLVHRRQVVRPGEKADPLAIGEGPLPIPIGQKREKILARFEATLAPITEGAPEQAHKALGDTHQLLLKPKRGTQEARDFKDVRVWYRTADLLPRMAIATHKDGSTTEVFLTSMKVNQPLDAAVFDPSTPKGWNEQIDDFRQPQNADE